ncbi:hypothetical protein Tco_0143718 [Tanacetum coccineum]
MGLWYSKDFGFELIAYSDADLVGCIDDYKSTSGEIQFLGDKLVSWSSKKEDCTTMSTVKAEYVSLLACCAQVIWMRTQLLDYGYRYNKIRIYCDSKSAIAISCNPVQHSRTKHINIRYHFIKEHVEKGTSDIGLIYSGEREYLVVGYSDLDYVADLDARRSLTGYVFTIGNLVVSWKATLQPSVALSTTKAEYIPLTEATKEGIWLKGLIEDFGFPQDQAIVFCDSMSAICLAKDQVYHDWTKHIDVRYHFIRTERRTKVKKIGTEDSPADVFTKPVPLSKFRHCLDLLNIDNWKYGVT